MTILRRTAALLGALLLSIGALGLGAAVASASTASFAAQSVSILQGVPATGNQVTLSGSNLPASFDPSKGTVNLSFSQAGLEGYVDSASATSVTMNIQVEPWVEIGSASVTISGTDGSSATCNGCLTVVGNSAGWSFNPPASSGPYFYIQTNPNGSTQYVNVAPVHVCPYSQNIQGCNTPQTTLLLNTASTVQFSLAWNAALNTTNIEPGATINVYGAPGQFVLGPQGTGSFVNSIEVTAESTAGSSLPVDPTLTAVVVRNPDGTVAICSDCLSVGANLPPPSATFATGYSFDPSPIVQFGNQLLVNGTITCSTETDAWIDYTLTQGSMSVTAARWANCQDAAYVSMAFPASDFQPGPVAIQVQTLASGPQQYGYSGVTVTTTATYSPPLLIGLTLDSTGYRGPGYAIFGATVTCNQAVSGTATVAFTLDDATVSTSAPATCGSNGLGYVVFQVDGPWSSGLAGVNASFSTDGNTGTTTGVVNIS